MCLCVRLSPDNCLRRFWLRLRGKSHREQDTSLEEKPLLHAEKEPLVHLEEKASLYADEGPLLHTPRKPTNPALDRYYRLLLATSSMSERKVLQKYYPPDFDPSKITRTKAPKRTGPKVQTVRLMAPFPMKCTACGEYIYKGRKFNARKETTDENYLKISIFRFYIRCTRCSGEITFKTDPRNMDYTCEKGAKRNFEPWRKNDEVQETDEEHLDRIELEEGLREEEERNPMIEVERKMNEAKTEMEIADKLDEIRMRNARNERVDRAEEGLVGVREQKDEERERQEREDAELARLAFAARGQAKMEGLLGEEVIDGEDNAAAVETPVIVEAPAAAMPPPSFKRVVKKKKEALPGLGLKKKSSLV